MDRNLRDLLELAVGEPPIVMNVEAVHRRAMRRRMAQLGAVGAAFALVAGLGATLAAAVVPGSPAPSTSAGTSGPPRYYFQQYYNLRTRQEAQVIRTRTTGRITASVGNPRPGLQCDGGVATAENETFFRTCTVWRGRGKNLFLETFIYRFQVTAAGRVSGSSQIKGGALKGVLGDNIAASEDGSTVAVEVLRPNPSGQLYTNTIPVGIFVINTRTGARVLWRTGPYRPGTLQYAGGSDLSLTRDGNELVVLESRCKRGRYQSDCGNNVESQVRAYGPTALGGSLETGRVLLSKAALKPAGTGLSDAMVTPDGTTLNAVLIQCPRRGTCTLSIARLAVGTGQIQRVLYRVRTGTAFQGVFERLFSVDSTGRYLILDAGAGKARVNGWIDRGRLVPLVPADGNVPDVEAW